MRVKFMATNMIALPLAFAYSEAFPGEDGGNEFAVIIGPIYISISWGH